MGENEAAPERTLSFVWFLLLLLLKLTFYFSALLQNIFFHLRFSWVGEVTKSRPLDSLKKEKKNLKFVVNLFLFQ